MDLKTYVHTALMQISEAVAEAQDSAPHTIAPGAIEGQVLLEPQLINFDISVSVSGKAGAELKVFSVADIGANRSSEQTNRISFSVPIFFQGPSELSWRDKGMRKRSDAE